MKIVNAFEVSESEDVRKIHNASAFPLHVNEHVMATMIVLQPGESLRRHATPVDVFFYVWKALAWSRLARNVKQWSQIC